MMRTYSRKTGNLQQLENALELCRLCLEKPTEAVPIFSSEELFSVLALRIMVCVGLEVTNDKELPNHICSECNKKLEHFHAFRKKCESSYQKLKSHVLAVKQRELRIEEELRKQEELNEDSDWDNKQALVFTLNLDGTIHLKNGNDTSGKDDEEPLITLKRAPLEPKIELQRTSNEIEQVDYETNVIIDNENSIAQAAPDSEDCTSEQLNKENLATFLSSTLGALAIITMNEDGTITLRSDTLTHLEVETGDGKEIFMELVEEDDSEEMETESTPTETAQEATHGVGNVEPSMNPDNLPSKINCNAESSKAKTLSNQGTTSADGTGNISQPNVGVNCKSESELQKRIGHRGSASGCGKRVPCAACGNGKTFSSRGALQRHALAVHAKQRPHRCALCGKRFAQREVWARHLLVHQEKRPFACEQCPKSFTQRGALAVHARLHAPPAARRLTLHQCPHCPKLFLHHSGLSRHMGVHLGKTWSCEACNRSFSDDSALRRHHRTCGATVRPPAARPMAARAHTATGDG